MVWIDKGTLALLFGMMVIVNLVSTTGVFEWFAIKVRSASVCTVGSHLFVFVFEWFAIKVRCVLST